jgi:hypothetical protein
MFVATSLKGWAIFTRPLARAEPSLTVGLAPLLVRLLIFLARVFARTEPSLMVGLLPRSLTWRVDALGAQENSATQVKALSRSLCTEPHLPISIADAKYIPWLTYRDR